MIDKLERLINVVYKEWKRSHRVTGEPHPDDESWACLLEGRLSHEENERIKAHLISCDACAEAFSMQLEMKSAPIPIKEVPEELIERAKNLSVSQEEASILEIILALREKALEILSTTGDVLVGQEFVPAPVLRGRKIKEFKDEVTILKDFKDIRVEIKIENKLGEAFNLIVCVKDKKTQSVIKDLRVALLKDDLELESYLSCHDKVTFEHVLAGKYTVKISNIENKIASVLLDIKR